MSNQFHSEDEALARLIREAGNPSIAPDSQYAEKLRAAILNRVAPAEAVADVTEAARATSASPMNIEQRTQKMKRMVRFAVAAAILMALGILASWITLGGGSTGIAFARVAEALDKLNSATFDLTSETKPAKNKPPATATGKGFFLAPARQRVEQSVGSGKDASNMVMIYDGETAKFLTLLPKQKLAMTYNTEEMMKKKPANGASADMFDIVRRIVREGSSGPGEKVEKLGKKVIDGHEAIGFRIANSALGDMTLWADPETVRPIRIEVNMAMLSDVHVVMNNFRYDVALDPSLFSLEPPAGYSAQTMNVARPTEEDFLRTLRTVAEQSNGMFPAKLGMNQEVMEPLMKVIEPELDKIAAKYGGKEKLREKYGKNPPPFLAAELMKATMPLMQKQLQGIAFYTALTPANDSHYVGAKVKLGTPDHPIFWYKPTGEATYHVIYADLNVKKLTPDEVKNLPEAKSK
jgi:outer membrane lipoprotein-sorting protein